MAERWETRGLENNSFHSSRKERYEAGNRKESDGKKGFFARNPSFKIFLIDLVFIIIISGVLVPFIYKREGVSSIGDYSLKLKAFEFDDQLMISLTVYNKGTVGEKENFIEAVFYSGKEGEEKTIRDLLPPESSDRILKASITDDGSEYVYCRVEIEGESKVLKKKVG